MTRGLAATALVAASLLFVSGCAEPESAATPPVPQPTEELPVAQPLLSGENRASSLEDLQDNKTIAPVSLTYPARGIDMSVVGVGVDDRNYMEIPVSIYEAGWYRFGPGPATANGATVIAAHVDMPNQGIGPFANLRDAQVGEEITVVDENGTTHTYRVVKVERIEKAEVPLDQVFTTRGEPTLVLITCGGDFDFSAQSYTDNYIVTAEKVS
ncbi:class F sortase [Microcella sp.]|uniref:class F sortase n=1 Tax=Microcella sp. TaxID=1913979 RepID=UPI00391C4AB3